MASLASTPPGSSSNSSHPSPSTSATKILVPVTPPATPPKPAAAATKTTKRKRSISDIDGEKEEELRATVPESPANNVREWEDREGGQWDGTELLGWDRDFENVSVDYVEEESTEMEEFPEYDEEYAMAMILEMEMGDRLLRGVERRGGRVMG